MICFLLRVCGPGSAVGGVLKAVVTTCGDALCEGAERRDCGGGAPAEVTRLPWCLPWCCARRVV